MALVAGTSGNSVRRFGNDRVLRLGLAVGADWVQAAEVVTLPKRSADPARAELLSTAALPEHGDLAHRGGGVRRPWSAAALLVALLGLVATPPTAVFVGKPTTATAAWDGGYAWLAVVGFLNTLVSLFYYLRWIVPTYRDLALASPERDHPRRMTRRGGDGRRGVRRRLPPSASRWVSPQACCGAWRRRRRHRTGPSRERRRQPPATRRGMRGSSRGECADLPICYRYSRERLNPISPERLS